MENNQHLNHQELNLLIIDDESGFADILAKQLSKRGIACEKANSGSQAIQIARNRDYDVALLDLKMEDMNGIEVLKILKKMVPDMPVIMLTGHGCETSAKDGMAKGAHDYLIKPCDLDHLISKIRTAVHV